MSYGYTITIHEVSMKHIKGLLKLPPSPAIKEKPHSKFVDSDAQDRLSPRGKKDRRRNWAHYSR